MLSEAVHGDGKGKQWLEKKLRLEKEVKRWSGYLHDVKIFQSTDNAMRQEALDAQREVNRAAIEACQEMRFPVRVLSDVNHSNVFVRSCIQAYCDADVVDMSEVRFSFLITLSGSRIRLLCLVDAQSQQRADDKRASTMPAWQPLSSRNE